MLESSYNISSAQMLRYYTKLLKECSILGLKELKLEQILPGMIIVVKKERLSKTGLWQGYYSYPKHNERYRVTNIEFKEDTYTISFRLLNSKKTFSHRLSAKAYFWVEESSY